MIKIQDSVPNVYYNSSRDFQLLAHLFDVVLNAVKTDVDQLYSLPFSTTSDDRLLDLLAFTFGLKFDRTKYTAAQIRSICSVAAQLMKHKGSIKAIELLCTTVLRAEGMSATCEIERSSSGADIAILLPANATCRDILFEMLPYILPAGMTFNIVQAAANTRAVAIDNIGFSENVVYTEQAPIPSLNSPLKPIQDLKTPVNRADIFERVDNETEVKLVAHPNIASTLSIAKPELMEP